ncbi:MAG: DUF1997 domain-containing protein [Cyanobacteria bacterium P01_D01_bin.105]
MQSSSLPSSGVSSPSLNSQFINGSASLIEGKGASSTELVSKETLHFQGNYIGHMEMYADAKQVAEYLDAHQDWFHRCAQPMAVEPIGDNGYGLTVGRFKSLNHEVEPKIGLNLLPQENGVYRIETIKVPGYEPVGYDVDFNASMTLCERTLDENTVNKENAAEDLSNETEPNEIGAKEIEIEKATHVEWELTLSTWVEVPRFIQVLPESVVKASGDKLLNQIVRQVSKRLTKKVQQDFHTSLNLPVPRENKRRFWQR